MKEEELPPKNSCLKNVISVFDNFLAFLNLCHFNRICFCLGQFLRSSLAANPFNPYRVSLALPFGNSLKEMSQNFCWINCNGRRFLKVWSGGRHLKTGILANFSSEQEFVSTAEY